MADKKGFNLAEVLGSVSNLDTGSKPGREQIEYIDIDLIDADDRNFYELSGIEDLAANIQLVGLQQPLRVRDGENGHVITVSGHRRLAAMQLLVDEGFEQFRTVPCIREQAAASDALQELRLIYANSDTRHMTSPELSRQAERVEALLYQLKEEGVEFPGRMRDHVAQACQVSKSKLARLKVIRENLIPVFMGSFESGAISEQAAYALARFPAEFQDRLSGAFTQMPTGSDLERLLQKYNTGWRWEPDMACPDGSACKRGDAFLRHDVDTYASDMCGGNTCCLQCDQATRDWSPCDRMCSKAKKVRSEKAADKKAKEEQAAQERLSKTKQAIQASAKRLLAGARDVDIRQSEKYSILPYSGDWFTLAELQAFANGDFGDRKIYSNFLDGTESYKRLRELAKALHCSADYIIGLTDDPKGGKFLTQPKFKPIKVDATSYSCGSCNTWIPWDADIDEPDERPKYCEECGCKIDWSDEQ